ncbi:CvpA family protein [Paenibacillus assamensis]|uniref:CvpA family protein n=1 Tax=Paenibacillus assamensis TaxID=311244 RepID=UPI000402F4D8|nr:CvpA family protein [Paenibacillus assamensis]
MGTDWLQTSNAVGALMLKVGSWNSLDILLTIIVVAFGLIGAVRGFKAKALSFLGWLIAFIVASRTYEYLIPWVRKQLFGVRTSAIDERAVGIDGLQFTQQYGEQMLHAGLSFGIMFGFTWIGLLLLKYCVARMSHVRSVRVLDRLGGAFIGVMQFFIVWGIGYVLLKSWPQPSVRQAIEHSQWAIKTSEWLPTVIAESIRWAQWL